MGLIAVAVCLNVRFEIEISRNGSGSEEESCQFLHSRLVPALGRLAKCRLHDFANRWKRNGIALLRCAKAAAF
jgi:hypothetical protein